MKQMIPSKTQKTVGPFPQVPWALAAATMPQIQKPVAVIKPKATTQIRGHRAINLAVLFSASSPCCFASSSRCSLWYFVIIFVWIIASVTVCGAKTESAAHDDGNNDVQDSNAYKHR